MVGERRCLWWASTVLTLVLTVPITASFAQAQSTDRDVAYLRDLVDALTAQVSALESRVAALESQPGSSGAETSIWWRQAPPAQVGPGVSGMEALQLLQQLPHEFWGLANSGLYVGQGEIRLDVPNSLQGRAFLTSDAFQQLLVGTDGISGIVYVPDAGSALGRDIQLRSDSFFHFEGVDPEYFQDFIRQLPQDR